MLLRDLTKVYISGYEEIEDHGEPDKKWKYFLFRYNKVRGEKWKTG